MVLIIDNYDSFTYNLVQYIGELIEEKEKGVKVYRNDKIDVSSIEMLKPDRIIISPGPGTPERSAGISNQVISSFGSKIPILGVCLGHQCIAYVFGGRIKRASRLMHGKTSLIFHNGKDIFSNVENPFEATRYHSLIVEKETLPDVLEIIAWTEDLEEIEIMGLRHKKYPIFGVQFHPESVLTKVGKQILANFLAI